MPVANSLMTPAGRHQLILAIADGASYCDSSSMYGGAISTTRWCENPRSGLGAHKATYPEGGS